jgi:hypothetical protein
VRRKARGLGFLGIADDLEERFEDLRWVGFLPLNFMRSTKLSATTKLFLKNETPPFG